MHVCVLNYFGHVQFLVTLWTVAHQVPLSMGFSRQGYWSRLPCPPPEGLPNPGIKPMFLLSPALACGLFTLLYLRSSLILISSVQFSHSVVSDSLWPHRLQPTRFLCLWDFPDKNTRVGYHFLLQGIFLTQGSKLHLLPLLHWQVDSLPRSHLGNPYGPPLG